MKCPFCESPDNKVIDSRTVPTEAAIRRRRECLSCNQRFTTYEYIENTPLTVVKADGRREPYNRVKIHKSLEIACTKRPVSMEKLDTAVNEVEKEIGGLSHREVPSKLIGEGVMRQLKELDEVAYVRFASVYRKFEAVDDFVQEVQDIVGESSPFGGVKPGR